MNEADGVPVYILSMDSEDESRQVTFMRCYWLTWYQWLARVEGHLGCWALPAVDGDEDVLGVLQKLRWKA